jgi:hypothetical protein
LITLWRSSARKTVAALPHALKCCFSKEEATLGVWMYEAEDPEEIEKFLEVGFEYVCEKNEKLFFRKRK